MRHKLIGYVGTADLAHVTEADAKNLDIINIAFGHVIEGSVVWKNQTAKEDLARLKSINPEIKFVLSIGGWGAGGFSEAAYTEEGRKNFSKTSIDIVL